MNAWYPKLNNKGAVIAGSGEIWLWPHYKGEGRKIAGGWHPSFYTDDIVVYYTDNDWRYQNINKIDEIIVKNEKVNLVLGGGGKIIRQIIPFIYWNGNQYNGRVPSLSYDGKNAVWVTTYGDEWTNVVWNGVNFTPPKQVFSTSSCNQAIVWTEFAERGTHKVFGSKSGQTIDDLTVTDWEDARVVDSPKGPVIISVLQDGIFVRKWKEQLGWRYYGVFDEPSAFYLEGQFVVVYSREGQLGYIEIDLDSATVPVDGGNKPPDPIPPDPEPIPPDPIPPKPVEKYPTATQVTKMESQEVALILIDGKFISFDKNRVLKLDNPTVNDDCKFTLTKPDRLWSIVHKNTKLWLGADATQHSPNVASQLYLVDHRQGYESWNLEHPASPDNDLISAFVVFRRPEGINFSVKLRVVEL